MSTNNVPNLNASPFYATRNMFRSFINYTKPLTFEEWTNVDSDKKAAFLYVQYFEQITLAWNKTRSFYTPEEDGVSTVLQYLIKNVPVIEENPKRYTAAYIYRVAYNCLYCICHDIKRDRERFENETSNICETADGEVDLFNTVDGGESIEAQLDRQHLWEAVASLGLDEESLEFVYALASAQTLDMSKLSEKKLAVIAKLRVVLEPYIEVIFG